jgi:cyclase
MLKTRVIPTLLWKHFGLVKGERFDSWRRVGPVMPAIRVYNQREVDELILVDILAHASGDTPDYDAIAEFGSDCFVPFTVGGGIRSIDQVQQLLRSGADKVSINTFAYQRPKLITEIADRHGCQCCVVSIDVKLIDGEYSCFSHSGTVDTGFAPEVWAKDVEMRGAGEILLTSIDRDGTMIGYDLDLIKRVTDVVGIPVIASGGAGCYSHMVDAVKVGNASAVAAASIFHFTEQTPAGAKSEMADAGIAVRIPAS